MNCKRVVWVLAVLHLLAMPVAMAGSKKKMDAGPDLRSSSALILDITHSTVLYSRNPDTPLPIASITKLMTSLVVADAALPLDETLEVTAGDRAHGKGTFSRLAVGTKLTRGELMHLALM